MWRSKKIEHTPWDHEGLSLHWGRCPACEQLVVDLIAWHGLDKAIDRAERLYPVIPAVPQVSPDIPERIADEYREAAKLRTISPRASAILARRCLQLTLRDRGFKANTLGNELAKARNDADFPAPLAQQLDMLREVGNYAAHPTEDGNGSFLEVEPGELDLLFATLHELFEFFYVKPKLRERVMTEVRRKVDEAKAATKASKY